MDGANEGIDDGNVVGRNVGAGVITGPAVPGKPFVILLLLPVGEDVITVKVEGSELFAIVGSADNPTLGPDVGPDDGLGDKLVVGSADGLGDKLVVGSPDVTLVGDNDGENVGFDVVGDGVTGTLVGSDVSIVGLFVGLNVGNDVVGVFVIAGATVGFDVGSVDGTIVLVGADVGSIKYSISEASSSSSNVTVPSSFAS